MRKLKLAPDALQRLLDELDAYDARVELNKSAADEFFPYRVPAMRVDLEVARDDLDSQIVPTRKLGSHGLYFLTGSLVHTNSPCRVHLVTIRNNWQSVNGVVASCRYLPGTPGAHEVYVRFDRPIDPASFAQTATRSRILAVDDSMVAQKLYARLLDTMNVDLTCLDNGLDAVEHALRETYDLILMDLEMPRMDGLSAARMLRSRGYLRSIVAVSAMTEPEDRERALAAGCDDFLAKPLTKENLANVVWRNRSEPLVSALLDDPRMMDLIDSFVDGLPEAISRLEAAAGASNFSDLEREARALKGEAAGIGFGTITDAALAVEHAARDCTEPEKLRPKLTELIRLCMSARPATNRPRAPCQSAVPSLDDEIAAAEAGELPPEET